MTSTAHSLERKIDLSGIWKLRSHDGQRGDSLERMLDPCLDLGRAWDARVPGDVHETLLEAGLIEEPALGLNSLRCRWVEERQWFYRRTFETPPRGANDRVHITFECLDLAAVIYLNGREIGRHANRFYPFQADITDLLSSGENLLVVQVESGLFHAMNRSASGLGVSIDGELAKRPWLRKPQFSFGWDWAVRLLPVGILGSVFLEVTGGQRVEQISAFTELGEDLRSGRLQIRALMDSRSASSAELEVFIPELDIRSRQSYSLEQGENRLSLAVSVPDPELWWPVGHGAARLYEIRVVIRNDLGILCEESRRVGFRHIRINQDPHPKLGTYFVVEVNRKPIFLKGANMVPSDMIDRRVTASAVETLLRYALEANCNCLRVWGGGIYESEGFYDFCDVHGLLVWQEFIFACGKYPAFDREFVEDFEKEAAWQVRRLAHHASLFFWCGNNEVEWGHWEWPLFQDSSYRFPDHGLFHAVLPRLMRREDPSRHYQPSSPSSPPGIHPNDPDHGDQHAWGVGLQEMDFRLYRQMTCRFPSEAGFLGPPALPTLRACLEPGHEYIGSFAWEHHDNGLASWGKSSAPDAALKLWFGRSVDELSLEDYTFLAGLLQGEALSEFIKNFRRRAFDSSGAIFWMLKDVWPTVRSLVIVDYYLRRTPAFHPVRRAFAPLICVVTREAGKVRIHGVNEGPAWSGMLRFGLCALIGGYPLEERIEVTLPANASTIAAEWEDSLWEQLGITSHVAFAVFQRDGEIVAQDRLMLPLFREMEWPAALVEIDWDGRRARFTSESFAWRVCLDLDGEKAVPDNFFDVLPGIPVELPWPEGLGEPRILCLGNTEMGQLRENPAGPSRLNPTLTAT